MAHSNRDASGLPRMTLSARLDHMRTLSSQSAPMGACRVLYTKAGTRLSAAVLSAGDVIVDHKAYWASAKSEDEAAYLLAILNSAAVVAKISDMQAVGEAGTKRDFDNLVWTLPIPEFDAADTLHRDLAAAARRAEAVAAAVPLDEVRHFVAKRRAVRAALADDGVAAEIEALVDALLPP